MATNLYFNNYGHQQSQWLIEDLIIESIKIYGMEVYYIPRTIVSEDTIFGEDTISSFDEALPLEMYIKNVDGFEGEGDFLSKFGLEIRDEMTFTVAKRRYEEEVTSHTHAGTHTVAHTQSARPVEGDLIYFPLNGKLFEIKFVEHEAIFYQMGNLQTYDLRCELFEYSHQAIDTGITEIDAVETAYSGDMGFYELLDEAGNTLVTEAGESIINDGYRIEDTDNSANNELFQTSSVSFIDFSESNPFSEGSSW